MTEHRTSSATSSSSKHDPIKIPSRRSTSDTFKSTSPSSLPNTGYLSSPTQMTPPGSPYRPGYDKRNSSDNNAHSRSPAHSPHRPRMSDDYRRYSGTVNHCGRHSNDWLFGGFSFRDTVRDGVDRLKQHHHHHHQEQHHQDQHHRQEYQQHRYHDQHDFERER